MSEAELRVFRDRLELPIPDARLKDAPYYHPGPKSEEVQYLFERRRALGGSLPKRVIRSQPLPPPAPEALAEFAHGSETAVSTTMVFTRLLRNLLRDPALGQARSCRSSPTRRGPSAWTRCSRKSASTPPSASGTSRSIRSSCCPTARRPTARSSRRGSRKPGSMASLQAAGTAYATHGLPMIPFYIFYSMFGFQRTGDQFWAFGDARGRGFLHGRHGRPHDAHGRGPPARRRPLARAGLDRAEHPRLRPGVRLRAGSDRPGGIESDVRPRRGRLLLHHALQRELPDARPAGRRRGGDRQGPVPVARGARADDGQERRQDRRRAQRSRPAHRQRLDPPAGPGRPDAARREVRGRGGGVQRHVVPAAPGRGARASSAGTGSIPKRTRGCRMSARCWVRTADRSWPPRTG